MKQCGHEGMNEKEFVTPITTMNGPLTTSRNLGMSYQINKLTESDTLGLDSQAHALVAAGNRLLCIGLPKAQFHSSREHRSGQNIWVSFRSLQGFGFNDN